MNGVMCISNYNNMYTVKTVVLGQHQNDADIGAIVTPWCHMNTIVLWEHQSVLL